MELVAADERMVWVEQLPQGRDRDFAERRVKELEILERLVSDADATCSVEELQGWTPWLQRRLAAGVRSPSLLTVLESSATTRPVRGLARNRLQEKRFQRLPRSGPVSSGFAHGLASVGGRGCL